MYIPAFQPGSRVRPQPEDQVITIRRECQAVHDTKFKEILTLSGHRPGTQKSLVILWTANVKKGRLLWWDDVLQLFVLVFVADTKSEYRSVCNKCNKREGKKKGELSLIDFHAAGNVTISSGDGPVQVTFGFSCYRKHQSPNDRAYW